MIRERKTANGIVHEKVFATKRRLRDALPEVWGEQRHLRDLMIAALVKAGFTMSQIAGTKFPESRQGVHRRYREMLLVAKYLDEEMDD